MKKLKGAAMIIAMGFIGIYAASNIGKVMRTIQEERMKMPAGSWSERVRYGDLYSFSHLTAYKTEVGKDRNALHPHPLSTAPRDIDLYAICDSYLTENFVRSNHLLFNRTDKFLQINLYHDKDEMVRLDPAKQHVLLIEKTEREVQEMLTNKFDILVNKLTVQPARPGRTSAAAPPAASPAKASKDKWSKLQEYLFNPSCNENLEELLCDYQLFTGLKEWKARMNEKLFGRIATGVVEASDGRHLVYDKTIDPDSVGVSSFAPLPPGIIDTLVTRLNIVYSVYRQRGFDYIYLCIIPNSATIVEKTKHYNQLIPLLYSNPALKMPVFDIYHPFAETCQDIVAPGDTHWNSTGFYLWLDTFNRILDTIPNRK